MDSSRAIEPLKRVGGEEGAGVWSKPVGDGEDKGDKEDKEEASLQPTTDDHAQEAGVEEN